MRVRIRKLGERVLCGLATSTLSLVDAYNYRTHSHERDKMEALSEVGLWVGRNLDSNQHLVIPLDAYDSIADEYVLGKLLSVSTVRVFDDQFPLRCIPTGDSDLVKFNDFVDRFDPLYQHAPIEGDGDLEGEYQVKSII